MHQSNTRITHRFNFKPLVCAALALASVSAMAVEASGRSNPFRNEVMGEPFKVRDDIEQVPAGAAGAYVKELNYAMKSISDGFKEPPVLELPGKLMELTHAGVTAPAWVSKVKVEDGQLYCVGLLKRHGLTMLMELGQDNGFTALEKEGKLDSEAFRQYMGNHLLQMGYYSYGHVVLETIGHFNKSPVTASQLESAMGAVPTPVSDEAYGLDLGYCANQAVRIAGSVMPDQRIERLADGRFQLTLDIEELQKAQAAKNRK